MSLPWFRVYANDTLSNEKLRTLPYELQADWFYLGCITRKCEGWLPDLKEISFHLRKKNARAKRVLEQLESAGLLERDGERLRPYDWEKTQPKSDKTDNSSARVRDFRERQKQQQCNVSCDENETFPVKRSESESLSLSVSEIDLSIDLDGIREALMSAVGAKVAPECIDISPIEQLVREGCYLQADILPVVKERVPALKSPLKSWGASWLLDAIRERASKRRESAVRREPKGCFVPEGTPQWAAWQTYERTRPGGNSAGFPATQNSRGERGWPFPTEWPPGFS
jgi:hypothetical protein